jgi:hypothetical protein
MVRYVSQTILHIAQSRSVRAILLLLLMLAGVLYVEWPVQAQTPGITSPATGSAVSGAVPIMGTAVIEPFQKYELHFKQEPSGDDAYIYFDGGTEPIVNGQLGVWQAGGLPAGTYSLRLRVVKNDGNYAEYFAQNIAVGSAAESTPTPTPTSDEPTPTPIPTATFTPAPQPTVNVGQVGQPQAGEAAPAPVNPPTDTPAVAAVAVAPEGEAAAEPAAAAESENASVIVNPENVADAVTEVEAESASLTRQIGEALSIQRLRTHFFNGVRYSAALFMVIGLIFVGRRILGWVRTQM